MTTVRRGRAAESALKSVDGLILACQIHGLLLSRIEIFTVISGARQLPLLS